MDLLESAKPPFVISKLNKILALASWLTGLLFGDTVKRLNFNWLRRPRVQALRGKEVALHDHRQ